MYQMPIVPEIRSKEEVVVKVRQVAWMMMMNFQIELMSNP